VRASLALFLLLSSRGNRDLDFLSPGTLGCRHTLHSYLLLVCSNGSASIMTLRNVHGNQPIGFIHNGLHVCGVVFRQEHMNLLRKTLKVKEGRQLHHPLHLQVVGQGMGHQQGCPQVVVGIQAFLFMHHVSQEALGILDTADSTWQ
jgi:hypothetical protein